MGRDKALLEIEGKSMIERVATSLATANLEPIRIAVALPEDVEEYGSAIGLDLDIEWVLDSNTYAGPIDAIEGALLDPECEDGLLQLATVDYPWASSEMFLSLQEQQGQQLISLLNQLLLLNQQELLALSQCRRKLWVLTLSFHI